MVRRRKGKGSTRTVADVMPLVYPAPDELEVARVFAQWLEVLPERVVANARPVRLSHGTLEVNVTSASWANELSFLERDLVAKLGARARSGRVKRIRFRVGLLPELPQRTREKKRKREPIPLERLPPEIARALAQVRDDDLREKILAAATTGLGEIEDDD